MFQNFSISVYEVDLDICSQYLASGNKLRPAAPLQWHDDGTQPDVGSHPLKKKKYFFDSRILLTYM